MSKSVFLRLLIVGLLLAGFVIACGGGGDGDGADDEIRILEEYQYTVSMPENTIYANFTQSEGETAYAFTVSVYLPGDGLQGTYNTDTGALTLSEGGTVNVNSDLGDELFGEFSMVVTDTFNIPEDGPPTSGELEIYPFLTGEIITIAYNPDAGGPGVPGVDLLYDEDNEDEANTIVGPIPYSWGEFEDLQGSETAENWERTASFAFQIFPFLFGQMDYVLESFGLIDENEDVLQSETLIQEYCDSFSDDPSITIPPLGVENPGTAQFSWVDEAADGEVGPGDSFGMVFSDCWENDQGDEYDDLLEGGIDFRNYLENIELIEGKETLTSIGYSEVEFMNFILAETYTEKGVCSVEEDMTTLTGTFSIIFSSGTT